MALKRLAERKGRERRGSVRVMEAEARDTIRDPRQDDARAARATLGQGRRDVELAPGDQRRVA